MLETIIIIEITALVLVFYFNSQGLDYFNKGRKANCKISLRV